MSTIGALIIAAILSIFGVDNITVTAFKELFDMTVTNATYYFIFLVVGLICDIVDPYKPKKREESS